MSHGKKILSISLLLVGRIDCQNLRRQGEVDQGPALPSSPGLQNLQNLDAASPDFQNQLVNLLNDGEYVRCIPDLGKPDLMWLVDYLDKVRHLVTPALPFAQASADPQPSR